MPPTYPTGPYPSPEAFPMRNVTRSNRVLAGWMLPQGFQVLGGESFVTLGRDKNSQVVVNATEVSRRHARISCEGPACTITDLGSKNGTFVNGVPVERSRRLDHDDLIGLGYIELRFLVVEGTREELVARFDQRAAATCERLRPLAREVSRKVEFSGQFSGLVLFEALQLLEVNRRSGALRVGSGDFKGVLRIREGLVIDARLGFELGERAARHILSFKCGEYAFESTSPGEQTGSLALNRARSPWTSCARATSARRRRTTASWTSCPARNGGSHGTNRPLLRDRLLA